MDSRISIALAALIVGCATTSREWTATMVEESYTPGSEEGYSCEARCADMQNVQQKTACRQECHTKHGGEYTPAQLERCSERTQITCEPVPR